jgi:hypothetical protein
MEPEHRLTRLIFGHRVSCVDGVFGDLEDVVIDPGRRSVTHLVVQPGQFLGRARLIPVNLAFDGAVRDEISLECTLARAGRLPSVHHLVSLRTGQIPVDDDEAAVGVKRVFAMPPYDVGAMFDFRPDPDPEVVMIYDRLPRGDVEIRPASEVLTTDGHRAGTIHGLMVSATQITHVLLRRGHRWRRRERAVPVGAVGRLATDSIDLVLSSSQLDSLPWKRVT